MDTIFESYIGAIDGSNMLTLIEAEPIQELTDWFNNESINEQLMMNMPAANATMAKAVGAKSVKDMLSIHSLLNVPTATALKTYLTLCLKFIKMAAISALSGAAVAQLIGWMFIGMAKLINKNASKNLEARQALINSKIMKNVKDENLSDTVFLKRYKELKKELTRKLNKEIHLKTGETWAIILDKVGKIKGKYGMIIFAIAGMFLYGNIASIPIFPAGTPIPIVQVA